MSSSSKSSGNKRDAGLNSPNKVKTLNPNAAEYVPSAFRSLPGNNSEVDVALLKVPGISRNAVLDRSVSDISIKSDDEAHEYWRHQLPDDITPDFKVMEEELQAPGGLSLAGLSINDGIETSRFPSTMGNQHLGKCQENSLRRSGYKCLNERMGYSGLPYTEDHSSTARMNLSTNPLDKQYINGDEHLNSNREGGYYGGNSNAGFLNGLLSERAMLENATMNPVALLASKFPGLAAESLEELYHANRCDLNLTIEYIEMHTQLKSKTGNIFNEKMNSEILPAPSVSELDFRTLPVPDSQNRLPKYSHVDLQQVTNAIRSVDKGGSSLFKSVPSSESVRTPDFASAIRRQASWDSKNSKYDSDGATNASTVPNINLQLLTSSYNGHGKTVFTDKSQGLGAAMAVSPWLETGDAMAQVYSEMREEGNDFARLRDACFEQAKQAYTIGNKCLAQELNVERQLYNIRMKEAHEKARGSMFLQRNPVTQLQSYSRAQDLLIDLHGLHVNEAINVLKHELNIMRRNARFGGQRLQVMIHVGTGFHTRGSRSPSRLPVVIQQYLLDENLQFSEDQPGLLRVLIC